MKITSDKDGTLVIGEVFSGAYIETEEGNRIGFCMRDDTIEFNIWPKGSKDIECRWFRVNMQTREIDEMEVAPSGCRALALNLTNAVIGELNRRHHIEFDGKLTHTGRDMVSEGIVEPFLRKVVEQNTGDDPK